MIVSNVFIGVIITLFIRLPQQYRLAFICHFTYIVVGIKKMEKSGKPKRQTRAAENLPVNFVREDNCFDLW